MNCWTEVPETEGGIPARGASDDSGEMHQSHVRFARSLPRPLSDLLPLTLIATGMLGSYQRSEPA